MTEALLDLAQCEREPVHTPGAVQPHAAFLAVEVRSGTICAASTSFLALVDGVSGGPSGVPTGSLADADLATVLDDASTEFIRALAEGARVPRPHKLFLRDGRRLNALGYLSDGLLMLDIEPVVEGEIERLDAAMLEAEAAMRVISAATDVDALHTALVGAVARVTGFDRVMLYEFDRGWNGSVLAEERSPAAQGSFLGLKFPSSDIPAQARALFLRNRVRQIVDVGAEPSPILPDHHPIHGGPLDLSDSQVRAVSPVHLRYLRNMGVQASLVIALVRGDALWGLLSCQHTQGPLYLPVRIRALCGLLGEAFSAEVRRHEGVQLAARQRKIAERLEPLTSRATAVAKASAGAGFATFMKGIQPTLLDLAAVDALWLSVGDQSVSLGAAPDPDRIAALVSAAEGMGSSKDNDVASTDNLAEVGLEWRRDSAGFAYTRIRDEQGRALAIRGERRTSETWAGDPEKRVMISDDGQRLDPRSSFERWTKELRGYSLPWNDADHLAVALIAERLPRWRLAFEQTAREALIASLEVSRAETRRLALVAERTGDAVIITDAEGRTQWVNVGFTRLSGYGLDDLRDRKPGDVLQGPLSASAETARMSAAIAKGEPVRSLLVNYTRRGDPYWIDIEITPVRDDSGAIQQFVSVARDATAGREQAEALRAARDAAEQVSDTKSQFLASVSHEIRTPMNGVVGMAELLSDRIDDPELRHMAQTILESGTSLIAILNDLLDLAKIEAGRLELEMSPFSPTEVLRHVQALHRPGAEKKRISLVVEQSPGCDRLRLGDRHRILQIFNNLVSNSVRFTDAGSVTVSMLCENSDAIDIVVADEGSGMTEALAARVFDPFNQADVSTARLHGGTGLGLSIVRHLVDMMGGTIDLHTTEGEGTRISIRIPASLAAVPGDATAPKAAAGHVANLPAGLNALAVDDNKVNRMLLKAFLAKLGVEARIATTGDEAVAFAKVKHSDVLLIDISMPGKDGLETLAEIREMERRCGRGVSPAVAVTANVMRHQVDAYREAGFAAYVAKPMTIDSLRNAMLDALRHTDAAEPLVQV